MMEKWPKGTEIKKTPGGKTEIVLPKPTDTAQFTREQLEPTAKYHIKESQPEPVVQRNKQSRQEKAYGKSKRKLFEDVRKEMTVNTRAEEVLSERRREKQAREKEKDPTKQM